MSSLTNTKTRERHSKSFNSIKKPNILNEDKSDLKGLTNLFSGSVTSNKFTSMNELNINKRSNKDIDNKEQRKESQKSTSKDINDFTNNHSIDKSPVIQTTPKFNSIPSPEYSNNYHYTDTQREGNENTREGFSKSTNGYTTSTNEYLTNTIHAQPLEPIHEEPTDTNQPEYELPFTESGNYSENDVQNLLLHYTLASGAPNNKIEFALKKHKEVHSMNNQNDERSSKKKFKDIWESFLFSVIKFIEDAQNMIYQYICLIVFNISIKFPKIVGILRVDKTIYSDILGENVVSRVSTYTTNVIIPLSSRILSLIKAYIAKERVKFKTNPYKTLFTLTFSIGAFSTIAIPLIMLGSFSIFYFFLYLILFIFVSFISALIMFPFLGASLFFAIGVIVFAFLSDVTYKIAYAMYIKFDLKLRYFLSKMSLHSENLKSQYQQGKDTTLNQVPSISNASKLSSLNKTEVELPHPMEQSTNDISYLAKVGPASEIARSLEIHIQDNY